MILIVEDETPIAEGLKFNFEQDGFEVVWAGNGPDALRIIRDQLLSVELVVLDLMLPGMSGYEICKEIRRIDENLPILVLSARLHSEDKAHAFDCGADQYLTKPFNLQELLSRVRNLLKRRALSGAALVRQQPVRPDSDPVEIYRFAGMTVDLPKFQVHVGDLCHTLTTMEMQLLRYFIENEGLVLSRNRILQDVWGQDAPVVTRSIDNFVMRLRRIIEIDPAQPRHLLSVRGTGYRFVAESEDASN